jgi:hypothetical protein
VEVAKSCFCMMGISFKGSEEGFLDFLTLVDEGQIRKKEVKNLECSINFDARGGGSSQVRAFLAASLPFPFIFPKCRE